MLANETKHHELEMKNRILELLLTRAQEEIKLYVSSKPEDKKKSVREQLLKQVCLFEWICLQGKRAIVPFYKNTSPMKGMEEGRKMTF